MIKKGLFTLIACLLPLILLLLAEGALRLTNYGKVYPLFISSPSQPDYLTPNPELIKRYFHHGATTPNVSPDTFYFGRQKNTHTLRIVLMGGSTAAGFPYGRFGSPAGLLTHQLRAIYPQLDIEVIPVAMASVNSYALRDWADEVAEIEPDAVLIYAGHNEYLGVMGVGSAYANQGGHFTNLVFLALKELRLFQLMQAVINSTRSTPADNMPSPGRTTMATMAKEQDIDYGSELFTKGVNQFKDNMEQLLSAFKREGIPVFMGNLVANEKDQQPFKSNDPDSLPSLASFLNNRMATQGKLAQLEKWQSETNNSANVMFYEGQLLLSQRKSDDALTAFSKAKDYDLLRFRAPSDFNREIANLAEEYDAHLVDIAHSFRQDSQNGIIGKRLMLEHLHPTTRGYFLMANGFLEALVNKEIVPKPTLALQRSFNYRWQQVPLSEVDLKVAEYKVKQLISDYPFTERPLEVNLPHGNNLIDKLASERIQGDNWLEQQNQLLTHFQKQGQWRKAANVAALLAESLPNQRQAAKAAANLYMRAQDHRLAWYYARQAIDMDDNDENLLLTLAEAQYRSEDEEAAKRTLERLLATFPDNQQGALYLRNLTGAQ